jgi:hypothetical protein
MFNTEQFGDAVLSISAAPQPARTGSHLLIQWKFRVFALMMSMCKSGT